MTHIVVLLAFFLSFFQAKDPDISVKEYSGRAYNIKDGSFLYSEFLEENFRNGRIQRSITKYKNAADNLICERVMTFQNDATKPKFELRDFRSGYLEGSEVLQNRLVKVYCRKDFNSKTEEKYLEIEEPFVIDGGLTHFFRQNRDRLLKNEAVEFNFVAPARLDYFRFRVSKHALVNIGNRKGLQLKLEINNFILRSIVDPVYITYAMDNNEILAYKGLSNINDDKGKSYSVNIDFSQKGDN